MRIFFATLISTLLCVTSAFAQNLECNITKFGGPVNFAGAYQHQVDLMRSWMPPQRFYIYINPDQVILHHSDGADGQTPASEVNQNGNDMAYMFIDYPIASNNMSRIRRTRITLNQSDLSFSIFLRMGSGPQTRRSGGSAWGQCKQI